VKYSIIWNLSRRPCILLRSNGRRDCRETRGSLQSRARSSPPLCRAVWGPRAVVRTRRGFPTAGPPPLRRRRSATTHKRAPRLRTTPTRGPPSRRAKADAAGEAGGGWGGPVRGAPTRPNRGALAAEAPSRSARGRKSALRFQPSSRPARKSVQIGGRGPQAEAGRDPRRRRVEMSNYPGPEAMSTGVGAATGAAAAPPLRPAGARAGGTATGLAAAVALVLGPRGPRGSACTPARRGARAA